MVTRDTVTEDYSTIASLAGVYLEDSYVLDIIEKPGMLSFRLEAVLTPENKEYCLPRPGEQYCYRDGELMFSGITRIDWMERSFQSYTDATGKTDYGNIDSLVTFSDGYQIEGDWGSVRVWSDESPTFRFV